MLIARVPAPTAYIPPPPRAINIALSGSGSHGAFGWGILDKLLEDGRFAFEGVAASGADAINAVILAYGLMCGGRDAARDSLETLWREISRGGALSDHLAGEEHRRNFHHGWVGAAEFMTASIDFGKLRRGRDTNLILQAANARTGQPRFFANHQITVEAILACSRLPQLTAPVRLGEDTYWDSRQCGFPAIEKLMLQAMSPDLLVGNISATGGRMAYQASSEMDLCCAERALNQLRESELLAFPATFAKHRPAGPASNREEFEVCVHQIRSTDVMADLAPSSRLDVRWPTVSKLRDMGRLAAEMWLQGETGDVPDFGHSIAQWVGPC